MTNVLRRCRVCGLEAYNESGLEGFAPQPNSKYEKANICKPCKADYKRNWRERTGKEFLKEQNRRWKQKLKLTVMSQYGGRCACCGESMLGFLTMDHINNDGKEDRERFGGSYKMYVHMRDLFYSDKEEALSNYQILCWNCNMGKSHNGGVCPHKTLEESFG